MDKKRKTSLNVSTINEIESLLDVSHGVKRAKKNVEQNSILRNKKVSLKDLSIFKTNSTNDMTFTSEKSHEKISMNNLKSNKYIKKESLKKKENSNKNELSSISLIKNNKQLTDLIGGELNVTDKNNGKEINGFVKRKSSFNTDIFKDILKNHNNLVKNSLINKRNSLSKTKKASLTKANAKNESLNKKLSLDNKLNTDKSPFNNKSKGINKNLSSIDFNDSLNISFFEDKSMNKMVKSYFKENDNQNVSILKNIVIENKQKNKTIELLNELYNLLGYTNFDNSALGCDIDLALLRLCNLIKSNIAEKENVKATNDMNIENEIEHKNEIIKSIPRDEENKNEVNFESEKELLYLKNKNNYLEQLIKQRENDNNIIKEEHKKNFDEFSQKEQALRNEISKGLKIENELRIELTELKNMLKAEKEFLKLTEEKLKEKMATDENTSLINSFDRIGEENFKICAGYEREIDKLKDELKNVKKDNKVLEGKNGDMEIAIDELEKKLTKKWEKMIYDELDREN